MRPKLGLCYACRRNLHNRLLPAHISRWVRVHAERWFSFQKRASVNVCQPLPRPRRRAEPQSVKWRCSPRLTHLVCLGVFLLEPGLVDYRRVRCACTWSFDLLVNRHTSFDPEFEAMFSDTFSTNSSQKYEENVGIFGVQVGERWWVHRWNTTVSAKLDELTVEDSGNDTLAAVPNSGALQWTTAQRTGKDVSRCGACQVWRHLACLSE